MKEVVEIIERKAEFSCASRPYLVKTEDGCLYFLKGLGALPRSQLCAEWLCAQMAKKLDIPVAPFELLNVPRELVEYAALNEEFAMRHGVAFGSQNEELAMSLPYAAIKNIPNELRWKILLFDWWIQNEDRTLGEKSGNVNLLWRSDTQNLVVIDHNLAFDPAFSEEKFFATHVFKNERKKIPREFLLEQIRRMDIMTDSFFALSEGLPDSWVEQLDNPGDYKPETVLAILRRCSRLPDTFGDFHHE